ncbi:RICIN domain-containing protein [Streptomyces monashensis]|uniref:RICIN domain-containing protein n=1 Tax=Streptomyces monashensis TaxID=1678012 RepID=UPI003409A050
MSTALAPRKRGRKWRALAVGLLASIGLCASPVTASASSSSISISNDNSHLCMSVPGDNIFAGQVIFQWTCGLYPDQHWYLEPSQSNPDWFYLQPEQNVYLCATYVPGSTAQLTLQNCGEYAANGNTSTQLFTFSYGSRNNALSTVQGWAMSVPGASTANGAAINIFPYGPYPDQAWFAFNS